MQGATAKHGAVIEPSANKQFPKELHNVAVSRPTELANLTLLNLLTPVHFTGFPQVRHAINQEYERLRNFYYINETKIENKTFLYLVIQHIEPINKHPPPAGSQNRLPPNS